MSTVLVRVLGAAEVFDGQTWRPAGTPKRGCVLAALAMAEGRPISNDTLVDRVWDEMPPRSARGVIHGHIAQLRKLLPARSDVALSRAESGGYRLTVPTDSVDVLRSRSLAKRARAADSCGDNVVAAQHWRQAAELWRGRPLSGVPGGWAERVRTTLLAEKIDILVGLYRAELILGRHAEVVTALDELVTEYPLSEPLVAHLIVALYRCDRPAEALARYAELRTRLRDELGNEPTERLRRLHQRVVRQDPGLLRPARRAIPAAPETDHHPIPVPAQLPTDSPSFVGRRSELDTLLKAVGSDTVSSHFSVVHGMAGIGKTTLAVMAANRLTKRFPDGQLFIDLHGFSPNLSPVDPAEALSRMLHSLGIPRPAIPDNVEDRSAMFRSVLASKRILVLLDNAADETQIRPLLPGNSHSSVLITSRRSMPGLSEAQQVSLDVLSTDDAVRMLCQVAGRPDPGEPANPVPAQVVQLCDRLPLALHLAGARLRANPYWSLADLCNRLVDESHRLAELHIGESDMATALAMSYRDLPGPQRRLFRLLGLLPGAEFDPGVAAALSGETVRYTEKLLEHLVGANLIAEIGPRRFKVHDLIVLFARERCDRAESADTRSLARQRVQNWYLHTARAARDVASPRSVSLPTPEPSAGLVPLAFESTQDARAWFSLEQGSLLAVAASAATGGSGHIAWLLADALRLTLYTKGDHDTLRAITRSGLTAAGRVNDRLALAVMRFNLAACDFLSDRPEHNLANLAAALEHAEAAGHAHWQAQILTQLGASHMQLGHAEAANARCERALAILRRIAPDHIDGALTVLALVCHRSGRLRNALGYLRESYRLAKIRGGHHQVIALANLAAVHRELGEYAPAKRFADQAVETSRRIGANNYESHVLDELALLHHAHGNHQAAVEAVELAMGIAESTQDARQQVATLITMARCRGDDAAAAAAMSEQAVGRARSRSAADLEASARLAASEARLRLAEPDLALDHAQQALRLAQAEGIGVTEGRALTRITQVHTTCRRWNEAIATGRQALYCHLRTGHRPGQADTHRVLFDALNGKGESQRAHAQLAKSQRLDRVMFA